MECQGAVAGTAESLAARLVALEEPWKSRFLGLVADWATGQDWDGRLPTQKEVVKWLGDWALYRRVALLLKIWMEGGESWSEEIDR
ncbi:MAG: hypothetical protein PVH62_02805 [Anaerolineae bacterium]|jgi:hypothetical protein